jgi:hypothetical protein
MLKDLAGIVSTQMPGVHLSVLCTPTQHYGAEDVPELLSTKVPDMLINLNLRMIASESLQKTLTAHVVLITLLPLQVTSAY